MEYSDNLIASAEDFAKMAKEYSSRLKNEKKSGVANENEKALREDIISILRELIWLYGYIKRNIRATRLKSIFLYMEEESKADLKMSESYFDSGNSKGNSARSKRLNNFISCVKLAISSEADLLNKLINLDQKEEFTKKIALKHLDFIKRLSNF